MVIELYMLHPIFNKSLRFKPCHSNLIFFSSFLSIKIFLHHLLSYKLNIISLLSLKLYRLHLLSLKLYRLHLLSLKLYRLHLLSLKLYRLHPLSLKVYRLHPLSLTWPHIRFQGSFQEDYTSAGKSFTRGSHSSRWFIHLGRQPNSQINSHVNNNSEIASSHSPN